MRPKEPGNPAAPTLSADEGPRGPSVARRTTDLETVMNGNTRPPRRALSARRRVLLATPIAGFGAAIIVVPYMAPKADFSVSTARAQNLTEQPQQPSQRPVGFADIVE